MFWWQDFSERRIKKVRSRRYIRRLLVSMAAGMIVSDLWTALFKRNSGAVEYQGRTSGWCSTVYKDLFSGNAGNGSFIIFGNAVCSAFWRYEEAFCIIWVQLVL